MFGITLTFIQSRQTSNNSERFGVNFVRIILSVQKSKCSEWSSINASKAMISDICTFIPLSSQTNQFHNTDDCLSESESSGNDRAEQPQTLHLPIKTIHLRSSVICWKADMANDFRPANAPNHPTSTSIIIFILISILCLGRESRCHLITFITQNIDKSFESISVRRTKHHRQT